MNADMGLFIAVAGLATLLVTLSLCRPLLAPQADATETPSGRRRAAALAALAVPLLATGLYAALGAPRAMLVELESPAHRMNNVDMTQATQRLAQKLKASPDDLEGWFVLARSYQAMERWREAADAYREALRLAPDDPQMMADLADVLATAQGGQLEGEPAQWVARALSHDSKHAKSHALAAMAAYRAGRMDEATSHWKQLAAVSPPGSEGETLARQGLERIKAPTSGR